MQVAYELTAEDLSAFQWRALRRSPLTRRTRRNAYLYLFLAFFLISLVPTIGAEGRFFAITRFNWLFLVISFPITLLMYRLIERRMLTRTIKSLVAQEKPDKGRLGAHTLSIDSEGVTERTRVGEQHSSWSGVDSVEEDADYIYIYTAPGAAHVVPRRAFKTSDDANEFFYFASSHAAASE